ncbi:MAG: hypothetical protein P4L83_20490 [Nevskia sp.]|nr:hypothetical protein [Nevskia sp.]
MATRGIRYLAWGAVAAALLALGWWALPVGPIVAPAPVSPAPGTSAKVSATAPHATPVPPPQQPADAAPSKLVDLWRRRDLEKELARSRDYLEFVRVHLAEARNGDADAQLLVSNALQMCENAETSYLAPAGELRQALADPASAKHDSAQYLAQLCDALFAEENEIGPAAYWRDLAAEQGVGAALLERAEDKERPLDQRLDDFRRALHTADPAVVSQLSYAGKFANPDAPKPDVEATQAIQALAQCRLGYDCSPAGALYDGLYCKSPRRNCQHADSVQRYYELQMKPQRFAAADEYSERLVSNLRSGRDDWPEAQALEQQIRQLDDADETQKAE